MIGWFVRDLFLIHKFMYFSTGSFSEAQKCSWYAQKHPAGHEFSLGLLNTGHNPGEVLEQI